MRNKFYTIPVLIIASTLFLSAQFTEKRSKRGPSMNTLKESCCTAFGDILHASADLLAPLAAVQKQALSAIEAYANGDKEGWCATASRQKLASCQEKLEKLHGRIEAISRECEQVVRDLKAF